MVSTLDHAALRKARGAFFTPPDVARYVAGWAVETPGDLVLEPSCGEAAFLLAAAERLIALRGGPLKAGQLTGVEVHAASAAAAQASLDAAGWPSTISTRDFFDYPPRPCYDAVIGNPPYIRFQSFSGSARAASQRAALGQGVRLSGLASSWAAFTVQAALFLKPGGRLGLVLPAELMSVNYAAEVRSFLMRRFGRVRLVLFKERIFPDVQEEVVLLLAEGQGPTDHCELMQLDDAKALADLDHVTYKWAPAATGGKWTAGLLSTSALEVYRGVETSGDFSRLEDWGRVSLGAVTGNNSFFALSEERVRALKLPTNDLVRLSPPGSKHLRSALVSTAAWKQLGTNGSSTYLFRPADQPSRPAREYIAHGEALGVHATYKCRVREPWWQVPLSPLADVFLTYMNAGAVQLATNRAGVRHLNSVHGVVLKPTLRRLGMDLLALASLNSMTLLGAEVVGRAYGGGMLKLEPREASVLPVPAVSLMRGAAGAELRARRRDLLRLLRANDLETAVTVVDDIVLTRGLGLSAAAVCELVDARAKTMARRASRGRSSGRA